MSNKTTLYSNLNTIADQIAKRLKVGGAFTPDADSGDRFTYGKLHNWANLRNLSNRLRNTTVEIVIQDENIRPTAHYNPIDNVLTVKASEAVTDKTLSSLIRHELAHTYQRSLSKGKAFGSIDRNKHSAPHKADSDREQYLKLQYEIDARFQQMLHELATNETVPSKREDQINLILQLMDKYHLTDIFISDGPRKKVRINNQLIRVPVSNKQFNKLFSRAINFLTQEKQ